MPIPSPKPKEPKADFISRCIAAIASDYTKPGQAAAVCYQTWTDAKKAMNQELLNSIKSRSGRTGVITADRYFRSIEGCFDGGFCPKKLFSGETPERWAQHLKEAESNLTYSDKRLKFDLKSIKAASDFADMASLLENKQVASKALAVVDGVVTTTKRDRDGDILETKGAEVDPQMPLLWQHVPVAPIGAMVKVLKHTDKILICRFVIADTELGNDSLKLIEVGGLRISHGFMPKDGEYEPLEDDAGWHFKGFEVYETSAVSVPSNTDAQFTLLSRNQLKSAIARATVKKEYDARPKQGIGFTIKESVGDYCLEATAPTADGARELLESVAERETKEIGMEHTCTCQKMAVPYKPTSKAPQDEAWDGDSAVSSLRSWAKGSDSELDLTKSEHRDRYRQGFAAVTGDGTNLGDYHLPHHKVSGGKMEVVFRGVAAAMGALNGARGGTSLSESDVSGARSHLSKHYEQFGEKPPESKSTDIGAMDPTTQLQCPQCGYQGPMMDFGMDEGPENMADMMQMGRSFEFAKKTLLSLADREPEKVEAFVLSLRGVLDQAVAHREDKAWQRTLADLGLD